MRISFRQRKLSKRSVQGNKHRVGSHGRTLRCVRAPAVKQIAATIEAQKAMTRKAKPNVDMN